MAMTKYMHPRNKYKNKLDFASLAASYPAFAEYVHTGPSSGKPTIDFSDKNAVRELSRTLLACDFGLKVTIPSDSLVPTIPLRLNYLLWLEDLLNWTENCGENVHGIDIGTGASCVYPLLAARKNGWRMTATDIREESVKVAEENVKGNNLEDLISIVKVEDEQKILVGVLPEGKTTYDFCMCNPPFFRSDSETNSMSKSRTILRDPPKNGFSGAKAELVAPGGELEFVRRIIADSKLLLTKIRIYTSMVGHKNNANELVKELQSSGAKSLTKTEFCQGNTTRWGIAWTFCPEIRLPPLQQQVVHNKKLFQPMELTIPEEIESIEYNVYCLMNRIREIFVSLQFEVSEKGKAMSPGSKKACFEVRAVRNTWSNRRRKRRQEQSEPKTKKQRVEEEEEDPNLLSFKAAACVVEKKIVFKLTWTQGSLGRDALHQIMQYLMNELRIKNK
ncbi:Hypothetical predicted protein [Cloeon dipterum]|uniref:U6 small nuclear RNA (adenine-(43)-N(6))-methyltransferase n=1 Tax=Cloeon dipterum TaxID=197152 RepID=A0A8S1DKE1_9INSE|nr:Hypothetical predicted protein [Cloeon dipterum]